MGSGGGSDNNIFGDGNFLDGQNFFETIGNGAVNYLTNGFVGMRDGKVSFEEGAWMRGGKATLKGIDEGVGEVTGRNQARKQLMNAEDQVRAEGEARRTELANQQRMMENNDRMASNRAGASRRRNIGSSGGSVQSEITGDFLGL